jgi:ABC-type oligopeptide transport system substrate-binding subunit
MIRREWSTAEFPMMSFLSISFSSSAAARTFIWRGAYNKMSSSETESTASDMSNLSYEQDLVEVGEGDEVDEGPLQHCRKLTT